MGYSKETKGTEHFVFIEADEEVSAIHAACTCGYKGINHNVNFDYRSAYRLAREAMARHVKMAINAEYAQALAKQEEEEKKTPTCGICGVLLGDYDRHVQWHHRNLQY